MCGIAGVFHLDGKPVARALTARMRSVIEHRGPDDEGEFFEDGVALVSRRLAILDLSAAGHQPMSNEDGTIWVTFNGEIYNYLELVPGHRFRSHCDTEVILHAYEEAGPDCVRQFNGMFAFAIWDRRRQQLVLARDRMGVKPLYYKFEGGTLTFGSEIKAILQDENVPRRADPTAIHQFLRYGYGVDDRTFFAGVQKLPPGHLLIVRRDGLALRRYWDIPEEADGDGERPEREYVEECRSLLSDAVRIRLRSDVPLGFHLSGGLDSSSVLALAARQMNDRPLTFSGAFPEHPLFDERPYIRTMVEHVGTDHHEIEPRYDDFPGELARILWFMDEPAVGPGVFPQMAVSRLCRRYVKVVLGGQGGDELFGGYQKYALSYARDWLRRAARSPGSVSPAEVARIAGHLLSKFRTVGFAASLRKIAARRKSVSPDIWTAEALAGVASYAAPVGRPAPGDRLHQEMLWDARHHLGGLLQVEDRVSMAVSIEARTPFLDYRLVEFSARVPPMLRMKNLVTKFLVREAVRDLLPPSIVDRRDKRGFPTPVDLWFRGPLRGWVEEVLVSSPRVASRGLFDSAALRRLLAEHQAGRDRSALLWRLLCVEIWFRTFIDPPAIPSATPVALTAVA
jgi:asparagine synthase (glutamine-hydrolysing)